MMVRATPTLTACVLFLACVPVAAATFTGDVVRVIDGDTVVVLRDHQQVRVRLAGIDAPERGQPFGERSRQNLARLIFRHAVTVDWSKLDRYGRTVGKIIDGGQDVCLVQVQAGMAWWYRRYASEQTPADRASYEQAEASAREDRIGLWSRPEPVPPWQWRRR